MPKGRADPSWRQKVLEWQASGKTGLAWSKKKQIPYTTLLGWKRRFEAGRKDLRSVITPKGLSLLVEESCTAELTSGAYFVFVNRLRDKMKVLYWDSDGFAIWWKRLEKEYISRRTAGVV